MEAGVKDRHLRHTGHQLFARADTGQVMRVVERTQLTALLNGSKDLFVNDHRAGEFLPAVQDAVTDR